ncbi:hypothetical protein [Rhizobium sp.]
MEKIVKATRRVNDRTVIKNKISEENMTELGDGNADSLYVLPWGQYTAIRRT